MQTAALRPNHYLATVRAYPQLEGDHELELARLWRDRRDLVARDTLIRAQLGYVVAIAVRYRRNNNVTLEELVAEGNFGLVHALAKFDPDRGNRLITYSSYWIRSHIGAHLMRSKTLVTSGVHSKLLSSVRRERAKLANTTGDRETADARVAEQLGISLEKLRSLIERANLRDVSWDGGSQDAGGTLAVAAMTVTMVSAEDRAVSTETEEQLRAAISAALSSLDVRERYIVERKLMAHREDELSLAEIGRQLGVSRERRVQHYELNGETT
jgi:RNA polymerase sigma-32 factor